MSDSGRNLNATFEAKANKGVANGYASLDGTGNVPLSQLGNAPSGTGGTPASTVTGPDAYGAAAVVGTSTDYARADHDHGLPAAPAQDVTSVFTRTGAVVAQAADYADFYPQPLGKTTSGTAAPLPFYNVKDYGAKGDGSTDDSAAIAAAVAAANAAGGGIVSFPPGVYIWSAATTLDASATNGIALVGSLRGHFDWGGTGGTSAASGTPGCEIRYTATGSQTFIDARGAMGFAIEDIAVRCSQATYTGRLVDAGANGAGSSSVGFTARNVLFSGTTSTANASILVYLDGIVEARFDNCTFGAAATAVTGMDSTAGLGFSNSVTFVDCRFVAHTTAALNPGSQWAFLGCDFESPVTVKSVNGTRIINGLAFHGCGFWDSSSGTTFFIDVYGYGLAILGGHVDPLGASAGFVRLNVDTNAPIFDGCMIRGVAFNGGSGTILSAVGSGNFVGLDIGQLANLGTLADPTSSLDLQTNNVAFAPSHSTLKLSSYNGPSGTLDLTRDSVQAITLTGTPSLSPPAVPTGVAHKLRLHLIQDATGSRTVTWPGNVDWGTAGAPTLSTAANAVDVVELVTHNGGVKWYANLIGKGF